MGTVLKCAGAAYKKRSRLPRQSHHHHQLLGSLAMRSRAQQTRLGEPIAFQAHASNVPVCLNVDRRIIWTYTINNCVCGRQPHVQQSRLPHAIL
jgi:hypothetical protein